MDVEPYRQILRQCFPSLTVSHIQFIGGGTFRVFEVNSSLIFRFPHCSTAGDLLRRERLICGKIGAFLPLPIPRYAYFAEGCPLFPQPVGGYPKLEGIALEECALDRSALRRMAAQLGGFLSALHSTPADVVDDPGLPAIGPVQARLRLRAFYAQIQQYVFPVLSPEEQRWARNMFEHFLADEANWQFAPLLVHGDFDSSNILYDPGRGAAVGILDFEEVCLGDPAWDFCVLLAEYGSAVLHDVLAAYRPPLNARFWERVAFHSQRILFHELVYGLQEGAQQFVDHGLERLRRAMAGGEPIGGWLAASTSEERSRGGFPG